MKYKHVNIKKRKKNIKPMSNFYSLYSNYLIDYRARCTMVLPSSRVETVAFCVGGANHFRGSAMRQLSASCQMITQPEANRGEEDEPWTKIYAPALHIRVDVWKKSIGF